MIHFIAVKYAGGIGALGLDSVMYTRAEVYGLKSDVSAANDVPLDYIPEDDSYHVVIIQKGYVMPHT